MKKNKFDPRLLQEELKRFNLLNEYTFYEEPNSDKADDDLLLGTDVEIVEVDDEGGTVEEPAAPDAAAPEAPVDPAAAPADAEAPADDMGGDLDALGDDLGVDSAPAGDLPEPEEAPEAPIEEPVSDDVEIDVTALVKGSEDAKASSDDAKMAADKATQNTEALLQKLADLENRIGRMDAVSAKIEDLEREIVKRNPTPVEKLEMRSLDSYPYSQKLSDYWADKEGPYDVMDKKPKEYTLTQADIDNDYSEPNIQKSFNDYEEEDI